LPGIYVYFFYVTGNCNTECYISNLDDLLHPPIAVHHQAELSALPI
jgi:hypothetical protein